MTTPTTAGYTLAALDADLDEVRANVDHGEAQYNPWALTALRAAERLREFAAEVEVALAEPAPGALRPLTRIVIAHAHLTGGTR